MPLILSSERQVVLSYRIAECDFERLGPFRDEEEPFCVLSFLWAAFITSGQRVTNDLGVTRSPRQA
jgi:hypothetical protein